MQPTNTTNHSATGLDAWAAEMRWVYTLELVGQCPRCFGKGTVLVDPSNRRRGETTCRECEGLGEL